MGPAWQKWGLPGRRGGCQAACGCTCADRVRQEAEAARNQDQAQRPGHRKGISPHRKARGSVGPAAVNLVLRPLPLAFWLLPWVNELVRVLTESRWHLQASRAARGGTRGALSAWRLSLRSLFTPSGAWADSSPDLSALRNRRTGFGHRPPPPRSRAWAAFSTSSGENQGRRPHRTRGLRSCAVLGPPGEGDAMVTLEPILLSKSTSSILSEDAKVRDSSPQTNSSETSESKAVSPNNQPDNRPTRIQNATFL